jgi:membrane protein YdbS with pleckstrin-like domain
MNPDQINGLFEFLGALMLARNVLAIYRDKLVRGVHWLPTAFFAAWGVWNLYYYPSLVQWWSFAGGIAIVSVNVVWFSLMVYYLWRERAGWKWQTHHIRGDRHESMWGKDNQ